MTCGKPTSWDRQKLLAKFLRFLQVYLSPSPFIFFYCHSLAQFQRSWGRCSLWPSWCVASVSGRVEHWTFQKNALPTKFQNSVIKTQDLFPPQWHSESETPPLSEWRSLLSKHSLLIQWAKSFLRRGLALPPASLGRLQSAILWQHLWVAVTPPNQHLIITPLSKGQPLPGLRPFPPAPSHPGTHTPAPSAGGASTA